jgi:hypothetical protein
MTVAVRPFRKGDRQAVRDICCDTGFMGDPVDPLFSDREVFADFFTRYYTDWEPENSLVAEVDDQIVGYLIVCVHYRRYPWAQARIVLSGIPRILTRLCGGRYDRQTRRFLSWFLMRAGRETPRCPRRAVHFHINLLPEHRTGVAGRRLIFEFFKRAAAQRWRVYGQIQTYDDRRPTKVFERFGFREIDRREITKFHRFGKTGVFVSTMFRDFDKEGPIGIVQRHFQRADPEASS